MTNPHLAGPWIAVLSVQGQVIDSLAQLGPDDDEIDICICRGSATPKNGAWPDTYSGDDEIGLWSDLEYDQAVIRWEQVQAMAAGLNAASQDGCSNCPPGYNCQTGNYYTPQDS